MAPQSLVGEELVIDVSDPWELTAPPGEPGRRARVVDERVGDSKGHGEALLLEFAEPIPYKGTAYRAAVATSRGWDSLLECLRDGKGCDANLYGIPPDKPPGDPLTVDWWRGGLGMIVALTLAAAA